MATFARFEEIEGWKSGRELRQLIYRLTRKPAFTADRDLVSQIRRAAQSVTSNIAEGHERGGNREFLQFLWIAKGSAGEVQDQLYAALDEGYVTNSEFDEAFGLATATARIIGGLIKYLQQTEIEGQKFRRAVIVSSKREVLSPKLETRNPSALPPHHPLPRRDRRPRRQGRQVP